MITMSIAEMETILLGKTDADPSCQFQGISIDTRTLKPGNLFIALQGEQFDGHAFLADAKKNGAAAVLVSRPVEHDIPAIQVENTEIALGKLAANWRSRFHIPLIGITGSNGKTTLKNMLTAILCQATGDSTEVLATIGNLNNHIGLPLTLSRLSSKHRYGVIEMGMNHFGEIAYLTELTQPAIAIITNAAECHLAGVNNLAGVAQAKGEIFNGLNQEGTAILNADDAFFSYWQQLTTHRNILTFGLDHKADITADIQKDRITLKTPKGNIDIQLPLMGRHNLKNALAATAAAIALNIKLTDIQLGLENVAPAPGRMQQYLLENEIRIIDDTYNANPYSLKAAVDTLATLPGTKIIVLGDMKELGPDEKQFHTLAGEQIRAAHIDHLFTLGDLSAATSDAFGKSEFHFTNRDHLVTALKPYLTNHVNVLVKGSRSMKMEQVIQALVPDHQLTNTH